MAQISAAMVKELRERTGSGMMECKKALQETAGDIEAAIEHLRKTGQAKAEKKASRTAAEGVIVIRRGANTLAMVEVNCETDFVAKDEHFRRFAEGVADAVVSDHPNSLDEAMDLTLEDGRSIEDARKDLIAKVSENVQVRRFILVESVDGVLGSYNHSGRIGVIVELDGGDEILAKDIAMHIAASRPLCINPEQVPANIVDKERDIYTAQAKDSGKPDDIVEKMVQGRLRKFMEENTLLGQAFVKNPEQSVDKLLKSNGASVRRFERFELGEGIEKKADNFVAEVMAQARGQ